MNTIEILLIISVMLVVILCIILFSLINKLRSYKLKDILLERNLKNEQNEKEFYIRENKRNEKELKLIKEKELKKINSNKTVMINNKSLKIKQIFNGKKVLVGDYNEWMIQNTKKVLMSLGFEVDTVESGDDIYDKIAHGYKCDVIVTNNIYKHGRNGIDLLHDLKSIKDFHIPIVVLTVSTGARNEFVYEDGFDEYMEKVLTQDQAEKVMTHLLLHENF